MTITLPDLKNMPPGVKLGAAAGGGGGAVATGYGLYTHPNYLTLLWIVLIALVFIVLLLFAWKWLIKRKELSQAKQFSEGLGAQFRRMPGQVTDADSRAKLDDLRRKLQEGFKKLSSAGKSPYVLPWYLMVGEPGSGKTKAISAASIALPGFQDPLQGAGGTVNMNWWFTNNGIILDTAGRLMLPEVATSNNPEWDEFLNTLNRQRANCPINGLILAIPADTLVTDSAERIDKKAGEISYQFNKIQNTLGIRFPVFVLITKCDKILGFREFFEGVVAPDEQAQLLGWSNPDKLDDAFRPELVEQHLQKVHEQLRRRRLRLLQNPIHTEDPSSRRIDQVDAMYELPDALVGLAPRLRRYLEAIFVAGPLSSRPLFLRGIYFTSSLQTGEALDKAFAEIMGIEIAGMQGEPIVSEKPYFLRHVFMEKAFKEKGLVTRTSNVSQLKRRRKLQLMGGGFAAAAAMMGVTWVGYYQLETRITEPKRYWNHFKASDDSLKLFASDNGQWKYRDSQLTDDGKTLGALYADGHNQATRDITVPLAFRPVTWFTKGLDASRREDAYRAAFVSGVIQPLVSAALSKMKQGADPWRPTESTAALRQLLLITEGKRDTATDSSPVTVLADYILKDDERSRFDKAHGTWDETFVWLFPSSSKWPPKDLTSSLSPDLLRDSLGNGLNQFIAYWGDQSKAAELAGNRAQDVATNLQKFDAAERTILGMSVEQKDSWQAANEAMKLWSAPYADLEAANQRLTIDLAEAQHAGWNQANQTFPQFYQESVRRSTEGELAALQRLRPATPETQDTRLGWARDMVDHAIERVQNQQQVVAKGDLASTLGKFSRLLDYASPDSQTRLYEVVYRKMKAVDSQMPHAVDTVTFATFPQAWGEVVKSETHARQLVQQNSAGTGGVEGRLFQNAESIVGLAARAHRYLLLESVLHTMGGAVNWQMLVSANAPAAPARIRIPLTGLDGNLPVPSPEFDPDRFAAVKNTWNFIYYACNPAASSRTPAPALDPTPLQPIANTINDSWMKFKESYARYWEQDLPTLLEVKNDQEWTDYHQTMGGIAVEGVNKLLTQLQIQRAQALQAVGATQPAAALSSDFDADCIQILGQWRKLDANAMTARSYLLALPMSQFKKNYLLDVSLRAGIPGEYWNQVFSRAFRSLARAVDKQVEENLSQLQQYHAFPLAPQSAGTELTPAMLSQAAERCQAILGAGPAPAAAGPLVGDPAASPPESSLDEACKMLRGSAALERAANLNWIQTIRPLALALRDSNLQCSIQRRRDPQDNALSSWDYAGLIQNQQPVSKELWELKTPHPDVDLPVQIGAKGGDVEFGFSKDAQNPNVFTYKYPVAQGPWAALKLIQDDPNGGRTAEPDNSDPTGATWIVTFKKLLDGNIERRLTFRVKFTAPASHPIDFRKLKEYWATKP